MSQHSSDSSSGLDTTLFGSDEGFLYVFFDPGESTGIAIFNNEGEIVESLQVSSLEHFIDWIEDKVQVYRESGVQTFHTVGYENYIIDPRTPQGGTIAIASQAIGIIRYFAKVTGAKIAKKRNGKIQTRLDKATGYAWWGRPVAKKSDPENHMKDAIAHGIYWLVSFGIRKTSLERRQKSD